MLNDRNDSNTMHWFVIDFFNDITGINHSCNYAIDVQSKAAKKISAKALGAYSVTLFKNYCSCLTFNSYVLFVGGIGGRVCKDKTKTVLSYHDMEQTAKSAFVSGLKEMAISVSYIDNSKIDENIYGFLDELVIVISDESKSNIIKRISHLKTSNISDEKFTSIFNEIRDKQAVLKNNNVEGLEIQCISDFLPHKKYLSAQTVSNLILHRLVDYDMDKQIPSSFEEIINRFEYDLRAEIVQSCKTAIERVLFDKNNASNFWALFSAIRAELEKDQKRSIDEVYSSIDANLIDNVPALDVLSAKLFISLIKESFKV